MEQEYQTIDLLDIFRLLKKNLILILVITLLGGAAGFGVSTFLMTPKYESDATLIVNASAEQTTGGSVSNDQLTSAKNLVDTYAVILTSEAVLNQTISNLHLDTDYDTLVEQVSVTAVNDTQVMAITVTDEDPEVAQRIAADITAQAPEVIIRTVKAGSVEVISSAKVDREPVSPSIVKNTAIGALLGFTLVVFVLIVKRLMNNKFESAEDITNKLGLTVLGVIPYESRK